MILVGLKKTQKQVLNVLFFAVFLISTGGAWIAKKHAATVRLASASYEHLHMMSMRLE
jgi:hypothetical protein